jgi:hypothetical protein
MSEGANIRSNSMGDVRGTVSHVMAAWEDCVRIEMPNTNVIYDEGLSYESAIRLFRDQNNYHDNNLDPLPLVAYKRTIGVPVRDRLLGLRADSCLVKKDEGNGTFSKWNVAYKEFDILFAYFTKDVELQERFEIAYNNGQGLSELEFFDAQLPELGAFRYSLEWNDLDEFTIQEDENNYFKSIIGSARLRGFFFSFDSIVKDIREINANIISSDNLAEEGNDELLSNCVITPSE